MVYYATKVLKISALSPLLYLSKVRKARNRRQEWNVLAYDKEFRPDARLTPSPYHGVSSEGSLSPDNRYTQAHTNTVCPCVSGFTQMGHESSRTHKHVR